MRARRAFFGRKQPTIAARKATLVLFLTRARSPESFTDEQLARQHQLAVPVVKQIREGVGRG
jgi:hypothetical protein